MTPRLENDKMLRKAYLREVFSHLETTSHAVYALLLHLSVREFALVRCFDFHCAMNGLEYSRLPDIYTLPDFLANFPRLHEEDEFRILFYDEMLYFENDFTPGRATEIYLRYVAFHCRKGLWANRPVVLTPELTAEYGLTDADVRIVRDLLDECNDRIRCEFQAEYDVLKRLDCLEK